MTEFETWHCWNCGCRILQVANSSNNERSGAIWYTRSYQVILRLWSNALLKRCETIWADLVWVTYSSNNLELCSSDWCIYSGSCPPSRLVWSPHLLEELDRSCLSFTLSLLCQLARLIGHKIDIQYEKILNKLASSIYLQMFELWSSTF